MTFKEKCAGLTNKEISEIIDAFFTCDTRECNQCPCDGVLCGYSQSVDPRKEFALEVARRLKRKGMT